MSSLDRLIDLAKRTGDRLIVHDPIEGRDVVILDVDEYERLVLGKREEEMLEDELCEHELDRIFNDDYGDHWKSQPEDWRSAGSVLEDRYGGDFEWDDDVSEDEIKIDDIPDFSNFGQEEKPNPVPFKESSESSDASEWKEEPLSEDEPVFYEEPV